MAQTSNRHAFVGASTAYGTTSPIAAQFGAVVDPISCEVEVGVATAAVGEPIRAVPLQGTSGTGTSGQPYTVDTEWARTPGANAQISHGLRGIVTKVLSVDTVNTSTRVEVQLQGCVEANLTTGVAAGDGLTFDTAGVLSLATVGQPIWAIALEAESGNKGNVLMFPFPIGTQLA